jgi:hypothetical protein
MIINAQRLGVTNTCEAMDCPYDADTWGLCSRHAKQQARGEHVRMHVIPDNIPDTLVCSACGKRKIDDDFARNGHASHRRRYRHSECRACCKSRNRRNRQAQANALPEGT